MPTLLLRLQAPMQSWGISSHFTSRDTTREPTKSGVIGLICAAMGRPRDTDISDLAGLKMGVRVDREGILQKDFHVAQNILQATGGKKPKTQKFLIVTTFLMRSFWLAWKVPDHF
jgi:CRISPR system Cascade subunit CasD